MSCKHYIEMMEYAEDAAKHDKPWELWECRPSGRDCTSWSTLSYSPTWIANWEYRRKQQYLMINGRKVPEPLRHVPPIGTKYYVVFVLRGLGVDSSVWVGDHIDKALLQDGLIHLVKEHAEIHSEALLSFTKKECHD